MAENAEREVESTISRARSLAHNWLETHIVQGGLLLGGNGHGIRAAAASGVSLPTAEVPRVRNPEEATRPGIPSAHRKSSAR